MNDQTPRPDTVDGDKIDRALDVFERSLDRMAKRVTELTRERDDLAAQVATLTAERDAAVAALAELKAQRILSVVFSHHPGAPRPFALGRAGARNPQYLGAQWPDGYIAVRAVDSTGGVMPWRGLEAMLADFEASGDAVEPVWLSDEIASLAEMEQERDQARDELAKVARERDALRLRHASLSGLLLDVRRDYAAAVREQGRMREVVEAAIALDAVEATRTDASDNCSAWLSARSDAVDRVLAAVERYQHPEVVLRVAAYQPPATGVGRTGYQFYDLDDVETADGPPNREDPLPGRGGGEAGPAEHRAEEAGEGRDPNVPVPGMQGLAPDVDAPPTDEDGTRALEAAIEAGEVAAARGWVEANLDLYGTGGEAALAAAVQRVRTDRMLVSSVGAAVRAAAPHIEREALERAADAAAGQLGGVLLTAAQFAHWLRARAASLIVTGEGE